MKLDPSLWVCHIKPSSCVLWRDQCVTPAICGFLPAFLQFALGVFTSINSQGHFHEIWGLVWLFLSHSRKFSRKQQSYNLIHMIYGKSEIFVVFIYAIQLLFWARESEKRKGTPAMSANNEIAIDTARVQGIGKWEWRLLCNVKIKWLLFIFRSFKCNYWSMVSVPKWNGEKVGL